MILLPKLWLNSSTNFFVFIQGPADFHKRFLLQFSSENQYLLRVNSSDPKSDHYYQVREHSSTQKLGINHIGIMDFVELFDVAWIYHDTTGHS